MIDFKEIMTEKINISNLIYATWSLSYKKHHGKRIKIKSIKVLTIFAFVQNWSTSRSWKTHAVPWFLFPAPMRLELMPTFTDEKSKVHGVWCFGKHGIFDEGLRVDLTLHTQVLFLLPHFPALGPSFLQSKSKRPQMISERTFQLGPGL